MRKDHYISKNKQFSFNIPDPIHSPEISHTDDYGESLSLLGAGTEGSLEAIISIDFTYEPGSETATLSNVEEFISGFVDSKIQHFGTQINQTLKKIETVHKGAKGLKVMYSYNDSRNNHSMKESIYAFQKDDKVYGFVLLSQESLHNYYEDKLKIIMDSFKILR